VSGQKFVYKFVSQPDPSLPEGVRNGEEGQRRDSADPNSQSKGLGGVASTCPSKGLPQVRFDCLNLFCGFQQGRVILILCRPIDWLANWSISVLIPSARHPAALRKAPEMTTWSPASIPLSPSNHCRPHPTHGQSKQSCCCNKKPPLRSTEHPERWERLFRSRQQSWTVHRNIIEISKWSTEIFKSHELQLF